MCVCVYVCTRAFVCTPVVSLTMLSTHTKKDLDQMTSLSSHVGPAFQGAENLRDHCQDLSSKVSQCNCLDPPLFAEPRPGNKATDGNGDHGDRELNTHPQNVALRHIARKKSPELPELKKE